MPRPRFIVRALAVLAVAALTAVASHAAEGFTDYQLANPTVNLKKAIENKLEKKVLKFGMIKLTDCANIKPTQGKL